MVSDSIPRIEARFRDLRSLGAKGLVIYLTAGDPSLEATGEILAAVDRGGADIIELGIPFSDPVADGPVIQQASERALKAGTTLRKIIALLPQWRQTVRAPIILFGYYNPILQYGVERFAQDLAKAGADGALIVDLSPEESEGYVAAMRREKLDTIFLAAPTSTDERIARLAKLSSGFLYLVSRTGVTGERTRISAAVAPLVARARKFTSLPVAVGFGVSNPEQVREVQAMADAAVVGSAVVHAIQQRYQPGDASEVEQFVRWLKTPGTLAK